MRTVAITDGGAGGIWFFGFFVVVALMGFLVIVLKGMTSAAGGSDAERGLVMKIAAAWLVGSAAFVAGYLLFWGQLSEIVIEDDGTWALRNAVGFELGAVGGGVERSAQVQWLELDEIHPDETLSPYRHQPAELVLTTVAGEVFEVYMDAGASGVLERLGYAAGGPCADPNDGLVFPTHTFTKRGPWCPSPERNSPERNRPAARAGEPVFALWSTDGWWYPARAVRSEASRAEVVYLDGRSSGPARSRPWPTCRRTGRARASISLALSRASWGRAGTPCSTPTGARRR